MRQFRGDNRSDDYFDYKQIHKHTQNAHLVEIRSGVRTWIPKAWVKKINYSKKRIFIKGYWVDEVALKLTRKVE